MALGAFGEFAAQIVRVDDPGHIPSVVIGSTSRWQHSRTYPAPTVLTTPRRRHHDRRPAAHLPARTATTD
jgi:hypothetical protein